MVREVLEGQHAVALGIKLCRPKVIAAYPITPATHIPEMLSELVSNGELAAEFTNVESEHSAISACVGAQATGVRTFTCTASQGLALMHEVMYIASGMRLPIVISVANRALSAPINIWCDHSDTMAERDSGWLQFFSESAQEALDLTIQAYKIAENEKVLLPAMVTLDGYTLTHTVEVVDVPSQDDVDKFLPPYTPRYAYLNTDNPITQGSFGTPDHYMSFKLAQQNAMDTAKDVIDDVFAEFGKRFGRSYQKIVPYKTSDAEIILVCLGSMNGTAKEAVDRLREKGVKVGLAKITVLRPFPVDEFIKITENAKVLAITDRNISLGLAGALFTEVSSLFINRQTHPIIADFIIGLGGRDITLDDFYEIVERAKKAKKNERIIDWINVG